MYASKFTGGGSGYNLPIFTSIMAAALAVGALLTDTHTQAVDEDIRESFGFAASHVWGFSWHRAVLSVFLTAGGWRFWASFAMLIACVGLLERRAGSRCACSTFWLAHVCTLLIVALCVAVPLEMLDTMPGRSHILASDVGPSAGYYGCLGLLIRTLRCRRWRQPIFAVIVLALVLQSVWSFNDSTIHITVVHAVFAHLVAVILGYGFGPAVLPQSIEFVQR